MRNTTYERECRAHERNRLIGKCFLLAPVFLVGVYIVILLFINILTFGEVATGGSANYVEGVHWPLKLLRYLKEE